MAEKMTEGITQDKTEEMTEKMTEGITEDKTEEMTEEMAEGDTYTFLDGWCHDVKVKVDDIDYLASILTILTERRHA
nr:hypothetical protein BgiMline_024785 [Biomphalaria glabrata]